jgi:hypothetical protein
MQIALHFASDELEDNPQTAGPHIQRMHNKHIYNSETTSISFAHRNTPMLCNARRAAEAASRPHLFIIAYALSKRTNFSLNGTSGNIFEPCSSTTSFLAYRSRKFAVLGEFCVSHAVDCDRE